MSRDLTLVKSLDIISSKINAEQANAWISISDTDVRATKGAKELHNGERLITRQNTQDFEKQHLRQLVLL